MGKWFWIDLVASFPYSRIVEQALSKPDLEGDNYAERAQDLKSQ